MPTRSMLPSWQARSSCSFSLSPVEDCAKLLLLWSSMLTFLRHSLVERRHAVACACLAHCDRCTRPLILHHDAANCIERETLRWTCRCIMLDRCLAIWLSLVSVKTTINMLPRPTLSQSRSQHDCPVETCRTRSLGRSRVSQRIDSNVASWY